MQNMSYLENLYETFLKDPGQVPPEWKTYFETTMESKTKTPTAAVSQDDQAQVKVNALINGYRLLGHWYADIDPLNMRLKPTIPELELSYYQFKEPDLNQVFETNLLPGQKTKSLKDIIQDLKTIYCGHIACEYMHIPDSPERLWVQTNIEYLLLNRTLDKEFKVHLFERITAAEGLEKYLGLKYPGAKRFSLEGCDTLLIALDSLIQGVGKYHTKEIVMGMAHRGRLNILVNVLGKNPRQLFDEFEGKHNDIALESGDVKYHQGFTADIETDAGVVHLSLAYNPSHLEIVSPVVCGMVRAKQEFKKDTTQNNIVSILLHGDAAFAGQGVIMEILNMSKTHGYNIGGTIHIITNNQIGFTTSDPLDARSTLYCSDIGKMLEIPIFHVNADDPEAVHSLMPFALEYRAKFKKDIIIDLVGYRRQGHNEADEPSVTQPMMYKIIRKLPTVCTKYEQKLIEEGVLTDAQSQEMKKKYRDALDFGLEEVARKLVKNNGGDNEGVNIWKSYSTKDWRLKSQTSVPLETIQNLGENLNRLPEVFELHPRVKKIMEERKKMTQNEIPFDWGFGEIMAYATLLNEGYSVRLTGQDCGRGTFFHRQAVLHNQINGDKYIPLATISNPKARFYIYDSLLSEEAVVGFEYGYSTTNPDELTIWEAQFGDFANNAQVVIDQFISSGEQKWGRLSALVLFLPHGYEGQGPEHSSARLERYLQLCAEHNIQVCVPSTPAQHFHMIRRQLLRKMRKPLIVLTPKSLLRHKLAVSTLQELSEGTFYPILDEIDPISAETVTRIVLCSGKIYYELLEKRRERKLDRIILARIEQLYPFPETELKDLFEKYSNAKEIVWCQEEPQNQGAWFSSKHHIEAVMQKNQTLTYAGRKPSAAPAVGYHNLHEEQQTQVVEQALKERQ